VNLIVTGEWTQENVPRTRKNDGADAGEGLRHPNPKNDDPASEGAVQMARELLKEGEHAELKTMANEIIREQEVEINEMQIRKADWSTPQP
jgi:hypothetical protein